jgi:hypothetical protein
MAERWSVEQVQAVAPSPSAVTAARAIATPASWDGLGGDDEALWGRCRGSGAEPYETVVDHVHVGFTCSCPSRRRPCKHALALLLLWVAGQVPEVARPPAIESWLARRSRTRSASPAPSSTAGPAASGTSGSSGETGATGSERSTAGPHPGERDRQQATAGSPAPSRSGVADATGVGPGDPDDGPSPPEDRDPDRDAARDERVERMAAGLAELDRWLDDRIRTGLADPAVARYGTWDALAARLVDAQAGSLANRIRRLAGVVGASPQWHSELLAELGMLHLLATAGRHLGDLPAALADGVATSVGWQVRRADVLAGVPDTDVWLVAGRSDQREDRIEVRRHWLRGVGSGRWALVLSFAAYQQSLDDSLRVGEVLPADLHRYPGPAMRALVGRRLDEPRTATPAEVPAPSLIEACEQLGRLLVREPWLDRVPALARAAVTRSEGRWVLVDDTGSLPIHPDHQQGEGVAAVLALSAGSAVPLAFEWTPQGVIPLSVFDDTGGVHDVGPQADPSFVGAA